jgi:hypothetical protein
MHDRNGTYVAGRLYMPEWVYATYSPENASTPGAKADKIPNVLLDRSESRLVLQRH